MDGGVAWNVNVASAVNKCKAKGFSEEQIIVDVALCTTIDLPQYDATGKHTYANWQRGRQIRNYYSGRDAMQTFRASYPNVQWRYLIM